MSSEENSNGFSEAPETVQDYVPSEERNGTRMESPTSFVTRMEEEAAERRRNEFRDYEARVHRDTSMMFMAHANNGEPLRGAMADFSRDVAERKLGRRGTTMKGYSWRIDTSNREPEKR